MNWSIKRKSGSAIFFSHLLCPRPHPSNWTREPLVLLYIMIVPFSQVALPSTFSYCTSTRWSTAFRFLPTWTFARFDANYLKKSAGWARWYSVFSLHTQSHELRNGYETYPGLWCRRLKNVVNWCDMGKCPPSTRHFPVLLTFCPLPKKGDAKHSHIIFPGARSIWAFFRSGTKSFDREN